MTQFQHERLSKILTFFETVQGAIKHATDISTVTEKHSHVYMNKPENSFTVDTFSCPALFRLLVWIHRGIPRDRNALQQVQITAVSFFEEGSPSRVLHNKRWTSLSVSRNSHKETLGRIHPTLRGREPIFDSMFANSCFSLSCHICLWARIYPANDTDGTAKESCKLCFQQNELKPFKIKFFLRTILSLNFYLEGRYIFGTNTSTFWP